MFNLLCKIYISPTISGNMYFLVCSFLAAYGMQLLMVFHSKTYYEKTWTKTTTSKKTKKMSKPLEEIFLDHNTQRRAPRTSGAAFYQEYVQWCQARWRAQGKGGVLLGEKAFLDKMQAMRCAPGFVMPPDCRIFKP